MILLDQDLFFIEVIFNISKNKEKFIILRWRMIENQVQRDAWVTLWSLFRMSCAPWSGLSERIIFFGWEARVLLLRGRLIINFFYWCILSPARGLVMMGFYSVCQRKFKKYACFQLKHTQRTKHTEHIQH